MNEVYIAIVSSLSTILLTYLKLKFDLKNKKLKAENKLQNTKIHKIKNHMFFTLVISLEGDLYSTFILQNKGKEAIFRFILYQTIKSIKNNFKILASKIDNGEIGDIDELKHLNIDAIEKAYRSVRELYNREDLSQDEKIALKITLDKFVMWNEVRYERLKININNITTSEFYDTPISMEAAILDVLSSALFDIISDAKSAFNTINGDLNGLIFKGVRI